MRTLFAFFVFLALIGIMTYLGGTPPGSQPQQLRLNQQRTSWCVLENENYAFWDKKFDRYASHWLETFRDNLPEDIRTASNLQTYRSSAWAHPVDTEPADSLRTSTIRIIHPHRGDRPKVSKPKD